MTARLSPRERAVAALVAEALTNKQIAARLEISESRVKNYITEILRKTGLVSRVAVALAVERKELERQ